MANIWVNEATGNYITNEEIVDRANAILRQKFRRNGSITSAKDSKQFFFARLAGHDREYFSIMFLDNKHKILKCDDMFSGTIDGASIYPREVVKAALKCNAAAVIFAHNHPSGDPTPSKADDAITFKLRDALKLVDIRVLDHIIVGETIYSYAEMGHRL